MDVVPYGLPTHDDGELSGQLDQAATRIALQGDRGTQVRVRSNKWRRSDRRARREGGKDEPNLFIAVLSQEVDGVPGEADGLPFEEGDVEAGGVVVDELEEEHLQGEAVLVVRLGPRQLCGGARWGTAVNGRGSERR